MAAISRRLLVILPSLLLLLLLISLCSATTLQARPGIRHLFTETAKTQQKESELQGLCEYKVEIKTSSKEESGIDDDDVRLKFGDELQHEVYVRQLKTPSGDAFHTGKTATFTVVGPCVLDVCFLYLYHHRHGSNKPWRPDYVKVYYGPGLKRIETFDFDTLVFPGKWYGFDNCIYNARAQLQGQGHLMNVAASS